MELTRYPINKLLKKCGFEGFTSYLLRNFHLSSGTVILEFASSKVNVNTWNMKFYTNNWLKSGDNQKDAFIFYNNDRKTKQIETQFLLGKPNNEEMNNIYLRNFYATPYSITLEFNKPKVILSFYLEKTYFTYEIEPDRII